MCEVPLDAEKLSLASVTNQPNACGCSSNRGFDAVARYHWRAKMPYISEELAIFRTSIEYQTYLELVTIYKSFMEARLDVHIFANIELNR